MSSLSPDEVARIRSQAAEEERAAILEMVEQSVRVLSHGRGADAALILQQLVDDIRSRE